MICNRADSFARRSAFAVVAGVEAFGLTHSVSTPTLVSGVVNRLGMRPHSKRKNNRFPVF
jgi:hypothetical protein